MTSLNQTIQPSRIQRIVLMAVNWKISVSNFNEYSFNLQLVDRDNDGELNYDKLRENWQASQLPEEQLERILSYLKEHNPSKTEISFGEFKTLPDELYVPQDKLRKCHTCSLVITNWRCEDAPETNGRDQAPADARNSHSEDIIIF